MRKSSIPISGGASWVWFALSVSPFCVPDARLSPPAVTLRLCDPDGLFRLGWRDVGKAVARIFRGIDLPIQWEACEARPGAEAPRARTILVVIVGVDPGEWRLSPNAMGAVLSRDGPQTKAYVFFDAVVRTVSDRPDALRQRWPTMRERRDLKRALSRVIAHEVIHAVLPSQAHADSGLTRSVLDRKSLLDPGVEIDPAVAAALRAALMFGKVR